MLNNYCNIEIVQYLAVFFGSLNIITSGLEYGWPSASLPSLQDFKETNVNLHLTPSEGSWAAVGPLLGAVLGSPLAGLTLDLIGRKKMIMFTFFPYMTSWITIAFATDPTTLFFGRFISGLSDGCIFTSLPIYIGEIASPKVRGLLGSSIPICLILGVLIVNILGAFLTVSATALVATIFPIVSFLGMIFMPESPYFLVMKGKIEEAQSALEIIRNSTDVKEELERIHEGVRMQKEESKGALRDIFVVPSNRKALLVMMLLRAAQQLSGITALIFYITTILDESGAYFSVTVSTIIFFSAQLVMSLFSSVLVDWTGRRVLLIWSAIGSSLSLFILGLYFQLFQNGVNLSSWSFVPITALIVYVIFYGIGLQNIPLVMLSELFPTNIKAYSTCFADLYFGTVATFVSKYFQIVNTDIGAYFAFYSFAASCVISVFLIYFFVPETKGITLEEIQSLLKTGKKYKYNEEADGKSVP